MNRFIITSSFIHYHKHVLGSFVDEFLEFQRVQISTSDVSPGVDLLETPNPQRLLGLGGTTPLGGE